MVYGVCDEWYLELGEDPITQMALANCLNIIGGKATTYDNAFTLIKWDFLSEIQVKYVQDIIITRDTSKLGISRNEVI